MRSESATVKFTLRGQVTVRVGKRTVAEKNDVSSDFALALAKTILVGTGPTGAYTSGFALPTSIVIMLLYNNAVVATIQANVSKFSDQMTNAGEDTKVTFVGSDATPSEYTFNKLELYTAVSQTLYMKVADVTLQSPITKNTNDIVEVTWVEEIISSGPFTAFLSNQTACSNCPSSCNTSTLSQYQSKVAVPNLVWALMLVPGLNKVAQAVSSPMTPYVSQVYSYYLKNGTVPQILGVTQVVFTDQCLNPIATVQVQSEIITYSLSGGEAVVALAMFITPTRQPYYALPVFSVQGLFSIWLSLVQVSNPHGLTAGEFSLVVEVPYGPKTLKALNVNG